MAHNYILRVTAGPSYETDTHKVVNVNTAEPLHIESDLVDVDVNVRVQVSDFVQCCNGVCHYLPLLPAQFRHSLMRDHWHR
jgi:hypothetical protein